MSRMINGSYIIEPEEPKLCEFCEQIRETRPIGTNNANIWYACAHKPEYIEETTKNLRKLIKSSKNVIINI